MLMMLILLLIVFVRVQPVRIRREGFFDLKVIVQWHIVSTTIKDKTPKLGSKLLSLRQIDGMLKNTTLGLESSSVAVFSIMFWMLWENYLCTETSGAVRKTGGSFKEKLREQGGLDAVFEVTINCLSDLETHLLGIKGKLSPKASPLLFTELIIVVIKRLSDQCLRQSASTVSGVNKSNDPLSIVSHDSDLDQRRAYKVNEPLSISSGRNYNGVERRNKYGVKKAYSIKNTQLLTCTLLKRSLSVSETPSTSTTDTSSLKMRISSSTSGSCSSLSKTSYCKKSKAQNSLRKNVHFAQGTPVVVLEDSQDPFAFAEDDSGLSKIPWLKIVPRRMFTLQNVPRL